MMLVKETDTEVGQCRCSRHILNGAAYGESIIGTLVIGYCKFR